MHTSDNRDKPRDGYDTFLADPEYWERISQLRIKLLSAVDVWFPVFQPSRMFIDVLAGTRTKFVKRRTRSEVTRRFKIYVAVRKWFSKK